MQRRSAGHSYPTEGPDVNVPSKGNDDRWIHAKRNIKPDTNTMIISVNATQTWKIACSKYGVFCLAIKNVGNYSVWILVYYKELSHLPESWLFCWQQDQCKLHVYGFESKPSTVCVCVCVCRGSSIGIDAPNSYPNIRYYFSENRWNWLLTHLTISGMNFRDCYCEVERVYVWR
jgi:hypothetical protein